LVFLSENAGKKAAPSVHKSMRVMLERRSFNLFSLQPFSGGSTNEYPNPTIFLVGCFDTAHAFDGWLFSVDRLTEWFIGTSAWERGYRDSCSANRTGQTGSGSG
jgi:hypothetical protein